MNNKELIQRTIQKESPDRPISLFDIVHLHSGGPDMTVSKIQDDVCLCRWFDGAKLRSSEFQIGELMRGPTNRTPIIAFFGAGEESTDPPWKRALEPVNPAKD